MCQMEMGEGVKNEYSRTSIAQTLMAHAPGLARTIR